MGGERLIDFVPGITVDDVRSDTGQHLVDIDPASNAAATDARTYSLRQLAELFNVLLRRSGVQARVTEAEKAASIVQEKVRVLEKWQEELTEQLRKRNEEVDATLDKHMHNHDQLNHFTDYRFKEVADL